MAGVDEIGSTGGARRGREGAKQAEALSGPAKHVTEIGDTRARRGGRDGAKQAEAVLGPATHVTLPRVDSHGYVIKVYIIYIYIYINPPPI